MEIKTKLSVGDEAYYVNHQGKIVKSNVESFKVEVGTSRTYTGIWVTHATNSPVQVNVLYKLDGMPAGFILTEDRVFSTKEELISNAK